MHYLMTSEDLQTLITLSEIPVTDASPVRTARINSGPTTARLALERVGLVRDGRLSDIGRAVVSALVAPERVVTTMNTALNDIAPVSYCFRDGGWTVYAPDAQGRLASIFSPIRQREIAAFARANLLHGTPIPPYTVPISLALTIREAMLFQLTQQVVARRATGLGRPLQRTEQWFAAADLFEGESLFQLAAAVEVLPEPEQQDRIRSSLAEASLLVQALQSLVEKGVLLSHGTPTGPVYTHSSQARTWLLADLVRDRIVVHSVLPPLEPQYYRVTAGGILSVRQFGESICFQSAPDFGLEALFSTV